MDLELSELTPDIIIVRLNLHSLFLCICNCVIFNKFRFWLSFDYQLFFNYNENDFENSNTLF